MMVMNMMMMMTMMSRMMMMMIFPPPVVATAGSFVLRVGQWDRLGPDEALPTQGDLGDAHTCTEAAS